MRVVDSVQALAERLLTLPSPIGSLRHLDIEPRGAGDETTLRLAEDHGDGVTIIIVVVAGSGPKGEATLAGARSCCGTRYTNNEG